MHAYIIHACTQADLVVPTAPVVVLAGGLPHARAPHEARLARRDVRPNSPY